jgi:hypothetical protein
MTRRTLLHLFALVSLGSLSCAAQESSSPTPELTTLSLSGVANQKLTDDQHGFKGNNLAKLELGRHDFAGVPFLIEPGFVALDGVDEKPRGPEGKPDPKPQGVTGIKVGNTVAKLHFLHGTGYGEGGASVDGNATIAEYVVHYADKTTASIPVVYGQDVRDWWAWGKPPEVTKGKIAWTGTNAMSEKNDQKIRLYLGTWENPKPGLKIETIDFKIRAGSAAEPFCIAITAEK